MLITKLADIIRLLERAKGGTPEELMEATGWQAHSVRGFISGTLDKKLKLKVESFKTDRRRSHLPRKGVVSHFRGYFIRPAVLRSSSPRFSTLTVLNMSCIQELRTVC